MQEKSVPRWLAGDYGVWGSKVRLRDPEMANDRPLCFQNILLIVFLARTYMMIYKCDAIFVSVLGDDTNVAVPHYNVSRLPF